MGPGGISNFGISKYKAFKENSTIAKVKPWINEITMKGNMSIKFGGSVNGILNKDFVNAHTIKLVYIPSVSSFISNLIFKLNTNN